MSELHLKLGEAESKILRFKQELNRAHARAVATGPADGLHSTSAAAVNHDNVLASPIQTVTPARYVCYIFVSCILWLTLYVVWCLVCP